MGAKVKVINTPISPTSKYAVLFIGNYGFDGWKCGQMVNLHFKPRFRTYNQYLDLKARGPAMIRDNPK